ncbi:hypothetical protein ACWGBO_15050 [[Kitasatospora] papulosa]
MVVSSMVRGTQRRPPTQSAAEVRWTQVSALPLRLWRPWPRPAAALLWLYTRVAAVHFAAITVSGICASLRKLPLGFRVTTAYGPVLVAKLLLVVVITGLRCLREYGWGVAVILGRQWCRPAPG